MYKLLIVSLPKYTQIVQQSHRSYLFDIANVDVNEALANEKLGALHARPRWYLIESAYKFRVYYAY